MNIWGIEFWETIRKTSQMELHSGGLSGIYCAIRRAGKCNGDPFLQQRMIEAMSKYAASIGFRGLKLMYKRYQQSIRTSQGAYIGENPTNFENQPIELDAGKWEADDSGVRRSDGFGDAVACPHPILPVERLVNIDTGEEKLRLAFRKGAIWRKIIVSKVILANANKVTELAGCGVAVTSQNARAFVEYISDIENLNYDVIPERKSIGRFGYIPDEGFSPFVDGLIFDGDASFAAMFQTVRSHGSEAKWLDIAAEVRAMSTTAKSFLQHLSPACFLSRSAVCRSSYTSGALTQAPARLLL